MVERKALLAVTSGRVKKKLDITILDWLQVARSRTRGVHARRRASRARWYAAPLRVAEWAPDTLWPSMGWRAMLRYFLLKVRRSASDPHHVALGMAIGMWANFLPLPGLGGLLSVTFAWLMRASMVTAFLAQLVGNAWTMPFIWLMCYKTGLLVFPLNEHTVGFRMLLENANLPFIMDNWRPLARGVLLPLAAGGQMLGVPLALLTYWLTHWEVTRFWAHRRRKIAEKRANPNKV